MKNALRILFAFALALSSAGLVDTASAQHIPINIDLVPDPDEYDHTWVVTFDTALTSNINYAGSVGDFQVCIHIEQWDQWFCQRVNSFPGKREHIEVKWGVHDASEANVDKVQVYNYGTDMTVLDQVRLGIFFEHSWAYNNEFYWVKDWGIDNAYGYCLSQDASDYAGRNECVTGGVLKTWTR